MTDGPELLQDLGICTNATPICDGFCIAFLSFVSTQPNFPQNRHSAVRETHWPEFNSKVNPLKCLQGNVSLNSPPNTWGQTERWPIVKLGTRAQRFFKCDKLRRGVQQARCQSLHDGARGRGIAHRGRRVKRNGDGWEKVQTSASTTKAECTRRVQVSRPLGIVYTRWMKALSAGSLNASSSVW